MTPGPSEQVSARSLARRLRTAGCVFAEDEATLLMSAAVAPEQLAAMVQRRCRGVPLEHLLGWADFAGLRMFVATGVFVPRRRTELVVREAAACLHRCGTPVVLDLCCGSGAVGAALASVAGPLEIHAVDIDAAACRCAQRNLAAVGGRVYKGNLYDPLPAALRGRVDLVVANAPYVPSAELALLPPEARDHEPQGALDGGSDGLDVVRRVLAQAPRWLRPGGHAVIETSRHQAPGVVEAAGQTGLVARVVRSAELDATAVVATWPRRA